MPLYSEDFIRRVREANDIVHVIESRGVALRRAGANLIGLCPFHREKTPSFNVRQAEQYFRCFGCDAKGDVITFVMRHDRLDFSAAVAELARAAGIPLESQAPGTAARQSREAARREGLLWAGGQAVDWFEANLWRPGGAAARRYLLERGFDESTLRAWRLGWAPDEWDGLLRHLTRGITDPERRRRILEYGAAAGLLRRKDDGETGRFYDAFRGRVMFPILDAQRRPVGFGGRVLAETEFSGGKYINSSEGKLFEKRKILFGLPQAARAIGERREAIVVEGYTDTIMCHQHGIDNVIATLGTALTEDHLRVLRRYIGPGGRVVAFFDNDNAGERATERAARLFMAGDVALTVARGLEMKDACAFLPAHGAAAFRAQLAKAEDSFVYTLRHTVGAARSKEIAEQAAAVAEAAAVVNLCPDPIKRAYMRKALAAEAGIPEATLPPEPLAASPVSAGSASVNGAIDAAAATSTLVALTAKRDTDLLGYVRLLAHMRDNAHWSERVMDELPPDEILDHACAEVAGAIRDSWQSGERPALSPLLSKCVEEGSAELLIDLFGPKPNDSNSREKDLPTSESELGDLLAGVRERRTHLRVVEIEIRLKDAQKSGDEKLAWLLVEQKWNLDRQMDLEKQIKA